MKLDQLPVEILSEICTFFPAHDVPAFRLCCRSFSEIGIRYLIPEVEVVCLLPSLQRLQAIAKHPVLRLYVRSVIYNTDVLPKYHKKKQWLAFVKDRDPREMRLEKSNARNGPTLDDIAWNVYRQTYAQQQDFLEQFSQGRNVRTSAGFRKENPKEAFKASIEELPAISSIEIGGSLYPHDSIPKDYRSYLTFPVRRYLDECPDAVALRGSLLDTYAMSRPLHLSLQTRKGSWRFFGCDHATIPQCKPEIWKLQALHLNISPPRVANSYMKKELPRCEKRLLEGLVRDVITSIATLETLELSSTDNECHELSDSYTCFFNLELVLGNFTWKNLHSLRLMQFETQETYLLDVLGRHAKTLKTVCCINMDIHPKPESLNSLRRKLPMVLDLYKTVFLHDFFLHGAEMWEDEEPSFNIWRPWLYKEVLDLRWFR